MDHLTCVEPPYSDEVLASFDKLSVPGLEPLKLFRVLAHNPRVLRRIQRGGLLDAGSIPVRLRELVILRTCALCGAEYEWGVHVRLFGAAAGLDEAAVKSTWQDGSASARWTHDERLVLRLSEALHRTNRLEPALWRELAEAFAPAQLVELTVLAGLYHAISYVVNACGVPLEDWAARAPA
jgi:alkylhydroperoxidase family enzyme